MAFLAQRPMASGAPGYKLRGEWQIPGDVKYPIGSPMKVAGPLARTRSLQKNLTI